MTKENFLKPTLKFYLSDEAKEKGRNRICLNNKK